MLSGSYPAAMRRLINELVKLPSIGEKSAVRLAYYLLTSPSVESLRLADALRDAREKTQFCEECFGLTEQTRCTICSDSSRQRSTLCVVEKPADVIALERCGGYRGLYHVLHGLWSPLRGVGPEQTRLGELFERLRNRNAEDAVRELVVATSTTVEGDATALYIAHHVRELGIPVTRIAQGLPKGGELEYADDITLSHALAGRKMIAQNS